MALPPPAPDPLPLLPPPEPEPFPGARGRLPAGGGGGGGGGGGAARRMLVLVALVGGVASMDTCRLALLHRCRLWLWCRLGAREAGATEAATDCCRDDSALQVRERLSSAWWRAAGPDQAAGRLRAPSSAAAVARPANAIVTGTIAAGASARASSGLATHRQLAASGPLAAASVCRWVDQTVAVWACTNTQGESWSAVGGGVASLAVQARTRSGSTAGSMSSPQVQAKQPYTRLVASQAVRGWATVVATQAGHSTGTFLTVLCSLRR